MVAHCVGVVLPWWCSLYGCRQVVLGSKLMTRNRLIALREKVANSVEAFLKRCDGQLENVMVAYTHVQHAQPISVAYWLSHYAAVILRDLDRLKRAYDGASVGMIQAGRWGARFGSCGLLMCA